jgi:hypothetical protein
MPQPQHPQSASKEAKVQLAKLAVEQGEYRSIPKAAEAYDAGVRTLRNRLNGMASRADCTPNSKKLTFLEEKVISEHTLDVDARGFQLTYDLLRILADKLLADRDAPPVGKNWPARFVERTDALKTRFNRKYDYRRALNEDPEIINAWFRLVRNMMAKYGILNDDVYNFDEAGFLMGRISLRLVITGSERR